MKMNIQLKNVSILQWFLNALCPAPFKLLKQHVQYFDGQVQLMMGTINSNSITSFLPKAQM